MIIGVLGNGIVSANNFVELLNGLFVVAQFVVAISQQIIIGIVPFAAFAPVLFQIGNGFCVLFQVEIALTNNFIEFRNLFTVRFGQLLFGHGDGFLKLAQLKIQVGLVI